MKAAWKEHALGELLRPVTRPEKPVRGRIYRQMGVRLWGEGAYEREPLDGGDTKYSALYRVERDDIVINKIWVRNGTTAVVTPELEGSFVSGEFPTFRADPALLLPGWVHWLSKTPSFWSLCASSSRGTSGKNRIRPEQFLALRIAVPDVETQRRILRRLEEVHALISELRGGHETAAGDLAHLAESVSQSFLLGQRRTIPATPETPLLPDPGRAVRRGVEIPRELNDEAADWVVPSGWMRISVAEALLRGLLVDLKDGNHGSNHPKSSEFVSEGLPFLMASDIADGTVGWESCSRLPPARASQLRVGHSLPADVLFTHKASIGRTAVSDRPSVLSPQVTYYRCSHEWIEPRWLASFLGSPLFLRQLANVREQSTRDFVSISKQYSMFLLLPPLIEQQHIATELGALSALIREARDQSARASEDRERLVSALVSKAVTSGL